MQSALGCVLREGQMGSEEGLVTSIMGEEGIRDVSTKGAICKIGFEDG